MTLTARAYMERLAAYVPLTDVERHVINNGWVLYAWRRRVILLATPDGLLRSMPARWREPWYLARRDSCLLLRCPICDAVQLVTSMDTTPMRAVTEHEVGCPISDDGGRLLMSRADP